MEFSESRLMGLDTLNIEGYMSGMGPLRKVKSRNGNIYVSFYVDNTLYRIDSSGTLEPVLNRRALGDEDRSIDFDVQDNVIHMLIPRANEIRTYDLKGVPLKTVVLKLPSGLAFEPSSPIFAFDESRGHYIISTAFDGSGKALDVYRKSKSIVGIFNQNGDFIKGFGQYPKYYSDQEFIGGETRFNAHFSNGRIYINHILESNVSIYDIETGDHEIVEGPKSNYMDYEIKEGSLDDLRAGTIGMDREFNHFYTDVFVLSDKISLFSLMKNNKVKDSYVATTSIVRFDAQSPRFTEVVNRNYRYCFGESTGLSMLNFSEGVLITASLE